MKIPSASPSIAYPRPLARIAHLRVPNAETPPIPVAPLRPLLGRERKTHLRFGDYAAVPACYQQRGSAMLCPTATLSDGFYELLDAANLDEAA